MRRSGSILTVLSLVCLATLSLATLQPQQDVGLHRRSLIDRHAIFAARQNNNDGGDGNNNNNAGDDGTNDGGDANGGATSTAAGASASATTTERAATTSTTPVSTSRSTSSTADPVSTTTTSSSTSTSATPSSTSTSTSTSSSTSTRSSTVTSSTTTSSSTTSSTTSTSSSSSSVASTTQTKTTAAQVAQGGVKTVTSTLQVAPSSTSAETVATESVVAAAAAKGASSNGFFSNKGAVAGTFTAVGLVVVAAIGFLFYRRRQNQRRYDEDEYFEKYPSANDAAPHAGADYDATTDPDAGHATQVAAANAYPPRDVHYGSAAAYTDAYEATPRPPKANAATGYDAHSANKYGAAGNYSSWLGPPPQAAGYGGGETDSRPNTQFAGVGAGFAANQLPQQYQSAHADLLADDGQGAYAQGQYQGYDQQQDPYAGQQQYQDQAYAVTTATAHPFADPANVTRGYGATNAGGAMMARNTYDRGSGDSFYGTGQAA